MKFSCLKNKATRGWCRVAFSDQRVEDRGRTGGLQSHNLAL